MVSQREATIEDLHRTPDDGKYELVDGRLVRMSPTGARPGHAAIMMAFHLMLYQQETGHGIAFGDNVGFIVDLPRRRSFSPDAAHTFHADIESDDFASGAPGFAVEIRSKGDDGRAMDAEYAAKRADYFAAGTQIVWDVDPQKQTISSHRVGDPNTPRIFARGGIADAGPALP
ncbi:MAG: Uma2 family endonuclease, partial [Thermomicrobia bacterium]|nr:Uma2 family endonuclease [Thermomicrobia bacterium]